MDNSTQVADHPTSAPAAEGTSRNSLIPTREQPPVKPFMQVVINNSANTIYVRISPGYSISQPKSQKPSQGPLQYPQQESMLVSKQPQPPRATVPQQPQPGPAASSQGSNPQQVSLPAQQTSHLNTEGPRVIQETQTFVVCQVDSTPQSHRQNVRSQGFQVSATEVQQRKRQGQTQNAQVTIIPDIATVSRADIQYSACRNAASKPSDRGTGGPPNPPRS